MKRWRGLLVYGWTLFSLVAADPRPNIVFIFSDDPALEAMEPALRELGI